MLQTRVGYAGGLHPQPTYHDIGDHAEATRVIFRPSELSYAKLLDTFLEWHTPRRSQGQYRSLLFPSDAEALAVTQARVPEYAPLINGDQGHRIRRTCSTLINGDQGHRIRRTCSTLINGDQGHRIRRTCSTLIVEPDTAEAKFWSAEDYHQKYRLRRKQNLVARIEGRLGPRWDEHPFVTKLNAAVAGQSPTLEPWLEQLRTL